jgi:hypothetical protein
MMDKEVEEKKGDGSKGKEKKGMGGKKRSKEKEERKEN